MENETEYGLATLSLAFALAVAPEMEGTLGEPTSDGTTMMTLIAVESRTRTGRQNLRALARILNNAADEAIEQIISQILARWETRT